MSKIRVLLVGATAAGALAASSLLPALADTPAGEVTTDIGSLHIHGTGPADGAIIADGDEDNPEPFDGSASLSSEGLCTSDDADRNNDYSENEDNDESIENSKSCNDEVVADIVGMIPAG